MILIPFGSSRSGTTITMDILSAHKNIHVTNEVRVFLKNFVLDNNANDYFRALANKVGKDLNYHRIPNKYDFKTRFPGAAAKYLKEDTLKGRLNAFCSVINEITSKDLIYVGDKGAHVEVILKMEEEGIDYRVVYIYIEMAEMLHLLVLDTKEV